MTRLRLLLLVAAFAAVPSAARAQDGIMEWIERLSGPGKFVGFVGGVRVGCVFDGDESVRACFTDSDRIRRMLVIRAGWLTTGEKQRFDVTSAGSPNDTRPVHMILVDPVYMFRLHPMVDVGAGGGFMTFSGEGFDTFSRFIVTPFSVTYTPFARRSRVFQVHAQGQIVPKGFTAADFGSTANYSTSTDFLWSGGFVFNFGALFR